MSKKNQKITKTTKQPLQQNNKHTLLPLFSHKRSQTSDEDLIFRASSIFIILLTHLHITGATSLGISILIILSLIFILTISIHLLTITTSSMIITTISRLLK